jgi:phytanoyl-CoA hydroxylase
VVLDSDNGSSWSVDARLQKFPSEDQIRFYRQQGFLVIRNLINEQESGILSDGTAKLISRAIQDCDDEDYYYKRHKSTGKTVPYRIDDLTDKLECCKGLLGHPSILRAIASLQGANFFPLWDNMVFKLPQGGAGHSWHRDAVPYWNAQSDIEVGAVVSGIYLDAADLTNCLWVIPGSHYWADDRMPTAGEFVSDCDGAIPIPVQAGDAILHNVLTFHASAPSQRSLRRVIYFLFRQIAPDWLRDSRMIETITPKQQAVIESIRLRSTLEVRDADRFQYTCLSAYHS